MSYENIIPGSFLRHKIVVCCCCFCIWKRQVKLVHPKLGGIIVWEFYFSKTSKPKSISLSFRCGLRFVNEWLTQGCRPGSTCSEIAWYEKDIFVVAEVFVDQLWACIYPRLFVRELWEWGCHAQVRYRNINTRCWFYQFCTFGRGYIVSYECLDHKHYEWKVHCKLGVSRL